MDEWEDLGVFRVAIFYLPYFCLVGQSQLLWASMPGYRLPTEVFLKASKLGAREQKKLKHVEYAPWHAGGWVLGRPPYLWASVWQGVI